ncbi:hypothetical protein PGSY75_1326200 [Plasmodium gaboni]|uniref:Uncharacterized protein n=1 Tax=Plasmodium gaboni TaxID=647221 RepID=A0A151LDP3_9APIC|nr:hypothetical protein PGSY75_1326200 [Plasmodium gaboni]KYN97059.1 hypothetical protein PGSY75_1326200 [Plasmodium gaboni]SOV17532.1 conserved Plasmodium protein, unknown function [Plasmodium gaboni]
MNENKKGTLAEKETEEKSPTINKNILFKEFNNNNDLKDTFVNILTDYSLESEKEKSNISLFNVFKKKFKEEKYYSRFLLLFKIPNNIEEKKCINKNLIDIIKEKYQIITGICLFVNVYSIMFLECIDTKNIFLFLKHLTTIKYISHINVLYFSELNKQYINEEFYFYEYKKEDSRGVISNECNCVDEVWELYLNILNLSSFIKNNKDRQNIFEKNEYIKKNFSLLQNFYSENAKRYIWNIHEFLSFFVDDFKLSVDDFSDDFIDF